MSLIETYRKKLAAQIEAHRSDIDSLKARAKHALAEGKRIGGQELDQADKHLDEAKAKFNELRGAGAHALADLKVGMKAALSDLQSSSAKAAKHFNQHAPNPRRKAKAVKAKVARVAGHIKAKAQGKAKFVRRKIAAKAAVVKKTVKKAVKSTKR